MVLPNHDFYRVVCGVVSFLDIYLIPISNVLNTCKKPDVGIDYIHRGSLRGDNTTDPSEA